MRSAALRLTRGTRLLRPQSFFRAPFATPIPNLRPAISAPSSRPFSHFSPLREGKDAAERELRRLYQPAELSDNEYHELSDYYLDLICTKYEDLQDSRTDVDVEFSV